MHDCAYTHPTHTHTHTDYIASSIPSSVTISAGDSRTCFNGTIVDDQAQEDTESFTLNIVGTGPDGVVVDQGTTEIVIVDDDGELLLKHS